MRKIILMSLFYTASLIFLAACALSNSIDEDSHYFIVDIIETQDASCPPVNYNTNRTGHVPPMSLTFPNQSVSTTSIPSNTNGVYALTEGIAAAHNTPLPFELQFGNLRGTGTLQLIDVNITGNFPDGHFLVVMHSPPGHHLPWLMTSAQATNAVLMCEAVERLDAYFVRDIMAFSMGTEDPIKQATWERFGPPLPPELQFGTPAGVGLQTININITGSIPAGYHLVVMHTPQGIHPPRFTGPASANNTIHFCVSVVRLDAYLVRNTQAFLNGTENAIVHASWRR